MPHLELYTHLVWATWDRMDSISPDWKRDLHRALGKECDNLGCHVLALNGIENHVHLLVSQPATLAVAQIAKQIKGATSLFVNQHNLFDGHFQWQRDYAAFSVSRWDRRKIMGYIERQKEHHANGTTIARLELPPLGQMRRNVSPQ